MHKRPYVVAHRGDSLHFPENTLPALNAAVALGVDWIELDVVTTSDGVVIVSHDTTAERCTDGRGAFINMTLEQVKALDAGTWFGSQFARARIPTLDEVISLVRGTGVRLCIEVKGDHEAEFLATARGVVTLLETRDFLQFASLSSFDIGCLAAARSWQPSLTVNLDPTPQDGTLSAWQLCKQCLHCGANFFSHTHRTVTRETVLEAHAHGLQLWAWTVNDRTKMEQMIALDVDAILSDDPALLQNVLRETRGE
jgi:glycerophosphoryl diester phosphodiesterase